MQIPDDLKQYNLEHASRPVRRRLVLTSEGGPGVGKTDLFYRTVPRPALAIQLDLNDDGIRERYSKDQDILFKNVVVPPYIGEHTEAVRAKDMAIFAEVRDLFFKAVAKKYFRSILIDEGEALYTLCRRAFLMDLGFGGSAQQSYAPINAAMSRFYTLAKQERINLYIPHRQTDEREEGWNAETQKKTSTPTGRKTAAGWKKALYESQCHLLLEKDAAYDTLACAVCGLRKKDPRNKKSIGCTCDTFEKRDPFAKFRATVVKCTANTKIEGRVFVGDEIDWVTIGMAVFPHSEEEEWR